MRTTPSSQDWTSQSPSEGPKAEVEGEVPHDTPPTHPVRRPHRHDQSSRWPQFSPISSAVAAVATVALIVGLISVILLHSGRSSAPSRVASTATSATALGSQAHFVDIQMVTPTDGWAVGYRAVVNQRQSSPLLARVANGKWTPVEVAYGGPLVTIAAISSDDIWAGGMPGTMLHYDGAAWRSVKSPSTGSISRIAMVGPSAGWAVGDPIDQHSGAFILHYDGFAWVQQAAPQLNGFVHLTDISMLSAQDGWAAGTVYPYNGSPASGVLLHYRQGRWLVATTLPSTTIRSIAMLSDTQGWAVGSHDTYETSSEGTRASHTAMLLRYAGGHWELAPTPTDSSAVFGTIPFVSSDDGWIVGGAPVGSAQSNGLLLLHYTGGRWTQIDGPPSAHGEGHSIDQAVAYAGGELWLAGSQNVQLAQQSAGQPSLPTSMPFLAHYTAGQWILVTQ